MNNMEDSRAMTDSTQGLDMILFEAIEAAATYTHNVTAEEADYIQNEAKQAILSWHNKQVAKARINEGQMFREAMINHSTPTIYWGKRLDELSLKEHKE